MGSISNLRPGDRALAGDGGGPHDDLMEHRVTALETRLDTILPTLATKADIESVRGDIKGWMLGTTLTIIATMVATIIALAHTKDVAPPASQPAPIIVQMPYPAQAPAPAAPSSAHR